MKRGTYLAVIGASLVFLAEAGGYPAYVVCQNCQGPDWPNVDEGTYSCGGDLMEVYCPQDAPNFILQCQGIQVAGTCS